MKNWQTFLLGALIASSPHMSERGALTTTIGYLLLAALSLWIDKVMEKDDESK